MGRYSRLFTIIFLAAAVLTSCSSAKPAEPQLVASPDTVSLMLADAAEKASTALVTLAAVEEARTPGADTAPVPDAPPELMRAMTISWVGPVEQLAKKLAARAGYDFLTVGGRPPVPLVISIDVENRPVIDILRDIGLQMGRRADLRVDARNQIVEIQYAPLTSTGTPG